MKLKYRIIKCQTVDATWFEVQRKFLLWWSSEQVYVMVNALFCRLYENQKFDTWEAARQFIRDHINQKRAEKLKSKPVIRNVFDSIIEDI